MKRKYKVLWLLLTAVVFAGSIIVQLWMEWMNTADSLGLGFSVLFAAIYTVMVMGPIVLIALVVVKFKKYVTHNKL